MDDDDAAADRVSAGTFALYDSLRMDLFPPMKYREESVAEWHAKLRKMNKPRPGFDTAFAEAEVVALERFLAFAHERGYAHSGYECEDEENVGLESVSDDLAALRKGLEYGPFWRPRGRAGEVITTGHAAAIRTAIIDQRFISSPMLALLRGKNRE